MEVEYRVQEQRSSGALKPGVLAAWKGDQRYILEIFDIIGM